MKTYLDTRTMVYRYKHNGQAVQTYEHVLESQLLVLNSRMKGSLGKRSFKEDEKKIKDLEDRIKKFRTDSL